MLHHKSSNIHNHLYSDFTMDIYLTRSVVKSYLDNVSFGSSLNNEISTYDNPTFNSLEKYIKKELSTLEDDWDGYGACAISPKVIELTLSFLEKFKSTNAFIDILDEDSVIPNPNGTLSIDWDYGGGNELFLEIGEKYSTYYFKKNGTVVNSNNNLQLDKDFVPKEMVESLLSLNS